MTTNLSNRAMLARLTISQWTARKFDKRETAELALKHGTAQELARVNKSLLPFAASLEAVHKKSGEIRTAYYGYTLPWQEGENIITSEGYMKFILAMRPMLSDWRGLVRTFLADYPQLRADAPLLLNGLYREADYPSVYDLERKFDIDLMFRPLPDSQDWRVTLADDEMADLKRQCEEQSAKQAAAAMRAAWERIHKVVTHAAERLRDPRAVFRDTLVENARDLCAILPSLNLTNDPNLESIRTALEGALCAQKPETLRIAPDVRAETVAKLQEIERQMGAFFTPAP